ncbi:MAG: HAD-IA family hydrolase [candidate division WOR-3 bacterium]
MALRYQTVLFDLDGTLIDSQKDIIAAVRHGLSQTGIDDPLDPEDILGHVGKPLDEVLKGLGYHLSEPDVQRFITAFRNFYARHFQDNIRLYPHVIEVLKRLRAAGVRTGIVTTKMQNQAELVAQATGVSALVDHIHGWTEGRQHKPNPEPVLTALRALGAEPTGSLMVGDAEVDILAARAAGLDTCAVTWGYRPAPYLNSFRPDYLIADLRDLVPIVIAG